MSAKMKRVTEASLEKYQTTTTTCLCPAHFYNSSKPCKHIIYKRNGLKNEWTWFPEIPQPEELPTPSFVGKQTRDMEIDEMFSNILTKIEELKTFIQKPNIDNFTIPKTAMGERLLKYNTTLDSCQCKGFQYYKKPCKHIRYYAEEYKKQQ